jgi:chemotaxis signal transduction protein
MSAGDRARTLRAQQLRAEFDHAFAAPPAPAPGASIDLLAIRCADQGFALPLSDVLAVWTDRKIVPVPAPAAEFLGLVGVRGLVAPVYDLRAMLGYPGSASPRWVALVRAPAPFALAFEHFEQHVRVPADHVIGDLRTAPASSHAFASGSVRTATGPRPLIDLPALYAAVTGGARRASAVQKEDTR